MGDAETRRGLEGGLSLSVSSVPCLIRPSDVIKRQVDTDELCDIKSMLLMLTMLRMQPGKGAAPVLASRLSGIKVTIGFPGMGTSTERSWATD